MVNILLQEKDLISRLSYSTNMQRYMCMTNQFEKVTVEENDIVTLLAKMKTVILTQQSSASAMAFQSRVPRKVLLME